MSTTRLLILGLVNWMQPVHGYDVRRELLSWNADKWARVLPGSIYHALKKMTEEGLLREVATEQVGARPARTTYELTPLGEDEFETLLRKYWREHEPAVDPFQAAFSLLPALPRDEAVGSLRRRATLLRAEAETIGAAAKSEWIRSKPTHVAWMFERGVMLAEAEAAWCDRVAGLIESGMSYLPEKMPEGTDGWGRVQPGSERGERHDRAIE